MAKRSTEASIGSLIDKAILLRDRRRGIEAEAKKLKEQQDELEIQILASLDAQGIASTSSATGQAVVVETTVGHVTDWAAFHAFVLRKKMPELLERRVSNGVYREMIDKGLKVPGVDPFKKRDISLKTL